MHPADFYIFFFPIVLLIKSDSYLSIHNSDYIALPEQQPAIMCDQYDRFSCSCILLRIWRISLLDAESRFPVGSSAGSPAGGWAAIALAIATLCCCPPDISFGLWSIRFSSPTIQVSDSTASLCLVFLSTLCKPAVIPFQYCSQIWDQIKSWKIIRSPGFWLLRSSLSSVVDTSVPFRENIRRCRHIQTTQHIHKCRLSWTDCPR